MADEELHRVPVNHESMHFKSAPVTPELKEKISDFQEQKQLPVPDVSPVDDHSWPEPIASTSASKATSPDEYFAVVAPPRAMQKTSDALMASGVPNFVIGLLFIVFMISVQFLVLAKHDNPILVFSGLGLFAFFSAMLRRSKMRSGIQQRAIEQKMLIKMGDDAKASQFHNKADKLYSKKLDALNGK